MRACESQVGNRVVIQHQQTEKWRRSATRRNRTVDPVKSTADSALVGENDVRCGISEQTQHRLSAHAPIAVLHPFATSSERASQLRGFGVRSCHGSWSGVSVPSYVELLLDQGAADCGEAGAGGTMTSEPSKSGAGIDALGGMVISRGSDGMEDAESEFGGG